jgi:hypothetical protein
MAAAVEKPLHVLHALSSSFQFEPSFERLLLQITHLEALPTTGWRIATIALRLAICLGLAATPSVPKNNVPTRVP